MKYRAEIDGLRAIAVVPVILFHAGFELFSGGFVGVDVFFVISGYLITTILIEDIENKRFSIINFYERRARRLLPALFLVMLLCFPFAWFWMLPSQMKDFSQSLVAVALFASNVLFWTESDYFGAAAEEKPLLHTWSLAVEEQYYVIFPIIVIQAWCFGKNRVFWLIVAMAAISLVLSEWGWRNSATANFYLAPTRAWELFAGSIAAFTVQKNGVRKNNILALLGLTAILFSIFAYDETTPFPSVYALLPVLGVVLLILYGEKGTVASRILSTRALVGVGLISYSAYLWHQPLFAFARIRKHDPADSIFLLLSATSLLLAFFSWKYVESRFRKQKIAISTRSSVFRSSLAILVFFVVLGYAGHITDGFKNASQTRIELGKLEERTAINYGLSGRCDGEFSLSEQCSTSEAPKVLLWGDSFAMHLFQGIRESEPSAHLRQITASSCSPILGVSRFNPFTGRGYEWAEGCIEFNHSAFNWLRQNKSIEFVVLSSSFEWVGDEQVMDADGNLHEPSNQLVLQHILNTIKKIKAQGVGVVVISPTPSGGFNIGNCLSKKYRYKDVSDCDFARSKPSYKFNLLKKIEEYSEVYWLSEDICSDNICRAEIQDIFIYRDAGHLSQEGSAYLGVSNNWYTAFRELAIRGK